MLEIVILNDLYYLYTFKLLSRMGNSNCGTSPAPLLQPVNNVLTIPYGWDAVPMPFQWFKLFETVIIPSTVRMEKRC